MCYLYLLFLLMVFNSIIEIRYCFICCLHLLTLLFCILAPDPLPKSLFDPIEGLLFIVEFVPVLGLLSLAVTVPLVLARLYVPDRLVSPEFLVDDCCTGLGIMTDTLGLAGALNPVFAVYPLGLRVGSAAFNFPAFGFCTIGDDGLDITLLAV